MEDNRKRTQTDSKTGSHSQEQTKRTSTEVSPEDTKRTQGSDRTRSSNRREDEETGDAYNNQSSHRKTND